MKLRRFSFTVLIVALVILASAPLLADDGGDGGGAAEARFTGVIQGLPSSGMLFGDWRVSGVVVHVSALTELRQDDGLAAIGATVEVRGMRRMDGSVDASRIEVKAGAAGPVHGNETEFVGVVGALPGAGLIGDWMVAGRTVHVTASTAVDQTTGMVAVGVTVDVRGTSRADGSVDATRITVKAQNPAQPERTEFTGVVTALPASGLVGDWTVGGRTVHVTMATRIEQEEEAVIAVGATVEVRGTAETDGSVDADRIEVKEGAPAGATRTRFDGAIETLPTGGLVGDWTVSGRRVHVSASTNIESRQGAPVVGALVEVTGTMEADGSVDATKIEVRQSPQPGPGHAMGSIELKGTVEKLASGPGFIGDWTVSGKVVHVTADTRIDQDDGVLAVGSMVEVKGTREADGSVDARKIEVELGPSGVTMAASNVWVVTSVARSGGKGNSFFTTDLTLSNPGAMDAIVQVSFLGHGKDGRGGPAATLALAAGTTMTISDVLGSLFGSSNDFGALRITSNVPTLLVSSTTSTPGDGGTFGQGLEAMGRNDFVTSSRTRSIAGVRQDDRFRTNLVIVNASEAAIDVDAKLVDRSGAVVGSRSLHLEPLEMAQIDDAPQGLGAAGGISAARILLSTRTPGGAFAAAATVIDNRTNDPRALLAR